MRPTRLPPPSEPLQVFLYHLQQIAVGIAVGIVVGIAVGIAGGIAVLRAYYHAFHPVFIWPTPKGSWYRFHPVAWDDMCWIPFPGLGRLLVAYAEFAPEAGAEEIERLISSYPSQRMAALRARSTLLAREAGRERNLAKLDTIVARLPEGDKGFLAQTPRVREMIGEICQLQRRLDTQRRPIFREPIADSLRKGIDNFRHRVGGFHEPLASEFRAAAEKWLEIAERQWEEARAVITKEPTPQIFRAADRVDRSKEAFVHRASVVDELGSQLMLSTGCPGLILYGRRRMGKSTLLENLSGFLPPSVRVVALSMQQADAFTSIQSFVRVVTQQIQEACPANRTLQEAPEGLPGFFNFLNASNQHLDAEDERLLLALDEYQYIDYKFKEGVFNEDLLATIRESIQSHRRLTWVFAGSHDITELTHAPWPSYLVSVRTVELPPFSGPETRLLLTEPLKHSPMWEGDDSKRPRFDPALWGEGGIERIHAEAGGWPYLVQLIAGTTVDLLNDEKARRVNSNLIERALDKAIVTSDVVLWQLMEGECSLPGEWEYLRGFRTRDTQPPPENEAVYRSLGRRLLVTEENNQWRLRVPLMQRWLRKRG